MGDGGMTAASQDDGSDLADLEIDDDGYVVMQDASEEDERALALFMPGQGMEEKPKGINLADLILEKIAEHEMRKNMPAMETHERQMSYQAVQVYRDIGKWLKTYKVGKIPKALKTIPSLQNWEEVILLTNPLDWSPAAMYQAVKLFSNANIQILQRFYNLVLLPCVRADIGKHKKLNFHYFRALRKTLFKPAPFVRGILLPLVQEDCTLREALIVGAMLSKASIPNLHAAAAITRLCEMTPWYATTSMFLHALINKKYKLPVCVIESLAAHFCSFAIEDRVLPIVWHRALLCFVQRYKFELNDDQKRRLKELLKSHYHYAIGAEVHRELHAQKPASELLASMDTPTSMDIG